MLAKVRDEHEDWTSNETALALHQKAEEMRREVPYTANNLQLGESSASASSI